MQAARCFGTIVQRSTPFSDRIKAREEVEVIEVTPTNRDVMVEIILDRLCELTERLAWWMKNGD